MSPCTLPVPPSLATAPPPQIEPKKHLEAGVTQLMSLNIVQCLGMMLDAVVF